MGVTLYVDNLDRSTTEEELDILFAQVGEVVAVRINRDQVSGESKGFGFITMGVLSEADRAVNMFNSYALGGSVLSVRLATPRAQRGLTNKIL